ncbi:MAG TPA: CRISPR system precrRNA processing endoribonuclease RAMP protein Cas6 [Xanthobacteraceae bacterium]|nr:CRISPR system precrRNA processing endoribonuclease RAMP protein Cas6 [Xanthobacteraceae bacterium]
MAAVVFKERTIICAECHGSAIVRSSNAVVCSAKCRLARRARQDQEREASRERTPSVAAVLRTRATCASWAAEHRGVKRQNPWLSGPPPYHLHLPGAAMSVSYRPLPQWPIELRNTPGLHGALTAILGQPHRPRFPNFALIPHGERIGEHWGVYWFTAAGLRLANGTFSGALFDRPTEFRFGPTWRFKAPQIEKRGRRRLRIDAVTPVLMRSDGVMWCVRPTGKHLLASLIGDFVQRLSPSDDWTKWVREHARVDTIEIETQPTWIPFGGHFGEASGWTGSVTVETNAVGHWLLVAAERMGLGSRTALGCGRIRVMPC